MEVITPKNSFLYTTDSFGKLERGVVVASITYIYESQDDYKFYVAIPIKKKPLPKFAKKRHKNRKF